MPRVIRTLADFLRRRRARIRPEAARLGRYKRGRHRIGRPVTQEEIAEAIGVTRTWYSLLETDSGVRPSLVLLRRVADTLMLTTGERGELFDLASAPDAE
ncbi:MAG: helix-turn-helix domain-containing protein [Candidatus Eremiobacteraeota bacterium]|nr:helix-turn-helix domain-containing protein [Candidatus Eremiobacteraeota bacterium]